MPQLMKGHKWSEHKHKMTYPCWVEVKYDEIRCEVRVNNDGDVQFLSYAGKPLNNLEQWAPAFAELTRVTGYHVFDCGVEVNRSFNDTYRYVRSKKPPKDLEVHEVRFILFDLPMHGSEFQARVWARQNVIVNSLDLTTPVILLEPMGKWAHDEEGVEQVYRTYRDLGVEGAMAKSMQHLYESGKRTYGWLKVKPSEDADGVITALHEAISLDGTPLGRTGSVTLRLEDGSEATPHGIPHDLGRAMHANPAKYLGEWAEFKYMERDRQGGYRHPVWGRLREAKA